MNLFYDKLSLQSDNKHFQSDSFITAWYEPETPFGDLSLKRKLQEKFVRIESASLIMFLNIIIIMTTLS